VNGAQQCNSGITLEFLGLNPRISQLETFIAWSNRNLDKIAAMKSVPTPAKRLSQIAQARQQVIEQGAGLETPLVESWIERSWKRCLAWGHSPSQRVEFDAVSQTQIQHLQASNQPLLLAAKDELDRLSRAIAGTRYFALLTDAKGMVIDTRGEFDKTDARASRIARVGINLSEQLAGTTAIGAVLAEQQPIWLHRGEHFFNDNMAYSCAGAPLFGPTGDCVWMLDLTGVDVPERPELQHLAALSARSIENNWVKQMAPALMLRFNWAGLSIGSDSDALIGLNADGLVVCANRAARAITGLNLQSGEHAGDVFATAWQSLFDLSPQQHLEVPLWTGLQVQIQRDDSTRTSPISTRTAPMLKAIETDLIRRAMQQAKGNVAEAARRLGISRATLYRKISPQKSGDQ
jgi:transcriptional regulator of acetoin/glycerol metabolism